MKSLQSKMIPAIFILIALSLILLDIVERPRVLIVYSYKTDSPWVREEDSSITDALSKSHFRPNMRKHYLGMDKSWSGRSLSIIKKDVERTINDFKPDILITMDDEARAYIAREYAAKEGMAIVFGGVDETPYWHPFFDQPNVTGILEELPLQATIELFGHLHKDSLNLQTLGDSSLSSRAESKQILSYDWGNHKLISSLQAGDFESWKKIIIADTNPTDVIFITGYRQLKRSPTSEEIVPGYEVIQWTAANTKSLLLSNDVDFVKDGGAITLATSPKEQGREAANFAIDIMSGKKPKDLPIKKGHEYFVYLSMSRITDAQLSIPSIYISAAQASNTLFP